MDLYMEVIPRLKEKDQPRAMELIRILMMDCVTDEDIEEQERAEKELNELIKLNN